MQISCLNKIKCSLLQLPFPHFGMFSSHVVPLCWTTQARRVPLPQKVLWSSIDPESLLASQKHPSPENVETLGQVSETFHLMEISLGDIKALLL